MANPIAPRASDEINIMNAQSANSAVFTATNATNTFNDTAHGLSNGNCVTVGTATTLPTGLSASTYYYIINKTDDTFQLSTTPGGSAVAISDDGTGAHTWYQEVCGDIIDVSDYRHIAISVDVETSPSVTLKCCGSIIDTLPAFLNPQSASNRYDFIQTTDLEDVSTDDGDTGLAVVAEDHRLIVINTDGLAFLSFKTLDFQAGDITIKLKGFRT